MDLDLTLPKALVNSLTSSGKSCSSDYDCSFYDCKSTCSLEANKCIFPVINTNLQVNRHIFVNGYLHKVKFINSIILFSRLFVKKFSWDGQCQEDYLFQDC